MSVGVKPGSLYGISLGIMIVSPKVLSAIVNRYGGKPNNVNEKGISAKCKLKRAQTLTYTTLSPL